MDFYNKTTEFSSDEFTESLDYIGKMIRNDNSRKEGTTWDIIGNYLFRTSQLSFDGSMMSTLNSYFYIYNKILRLLLTERRLLFQTTIKRRMQYQHLFNVVLH